MIRIVIDHDIIGVPEPAVHVADVIGRDAPAKSAKPEERGSAAADTPYMAAADPAGETAVFPGTIQMIVRVFASTLVANPFAIRVNVRRFRMPFAVIKLAGLRGMLFGRTRRRVSIDMRRPYRSRSALRDIASAHFRLC